MINRVILLGNVGKNPEIRSMQNGKEVASFSLATTEYWKDKQTGEKRDKTEWHNIVVFSSGLINVIRKYVKKGSKLYIEGALQTREWTDKNETKRKTTEIVLHGFNCAMQIINYSEGAKQESSNNSVPVQKEAEEDFIDE
jgi:single-strand DNA-binding protein